VLESPTTLGFTAYQVGLAGTLYLAGAIGIRARISCKAEKGVAYCMGEKCISV
jgi:hypothetical protein